MSTYTEKQRKYHLRKMRTRMKRADVSGDGYITREDYELIGIKLAEYGKMSEKKAKETREAFLKVADELGLVSGVKIAVEEAAQNATKSLLNMTEEEKKESLALCDIMYNLIDFDDSGSVSFPEFKAFLQAMGPDIDDKHAKWCFDTLDADGDGIISRKEFMVAADDFLHGVEETPVANAFYGKLIDDE